MPLNNQNSFLLNDGYRIPKIGFGTYKAQREGGIKSVTEALSLGYRLIDTAWAYGNEQAVGQAIKASGLLRSDIFLTTKVWREHLGYESTKAAVAASLKDLGVDYIDLYLIHWPANQKNYKDWKSTNAATWRAMEELKASGKIKSIGVSNFWPEHLDALLATARIIPAVNQIEFHPGYWQAEVTQYCKDKGILVQSWSPLARGKVFENELLKTLSIKYKKSISQICLRWILQQGVTAIPKTVTTDRMKENLSLFDFELSSADMLSISEIPKMGFSGELPNHWPDRVSK